MTDPYETKHLEARARRLAALIRGSGPEPTQLIIEYEDVMNKLGAVKMAQKMGARPE